MKMELMAGEKQRWKHKDSTYQEWKGKEKMLGFLEGQSVNMVPTNQRVFHPAGP